MRSHPNAASAPSTHRENRTLSLGVLAAMLVCAAACLGIGAPAAGAATAGQSYGYQSDIGTGGTGPASDQFSKTVAVSDDGRIFLSRQLDVNVFEGGFELLGPDGSPITVQTTGALRPTGIAVAPDGTAVYLSGTVDEGTSLKRFVSDGAPTPAYTEDPDWSPGLFPTDVAVDPATSDVLVADHGSILRLDPDSGEVLSSISGFAAGKIAVALNGDIYALDERGIHVRRLGPDGTLKAELDLPPQNNSWQGAGIAVNPQNGDVAMRFPSGFVTDHDAAIRVFTAGDDLKEDIRIPPSIAGDNFGLAYSPDATKLYVGTKTGTAHVFALGTKPGLDGPTVSQLTPTGLHLSDSVATGDKPTEARFEYCLASEECGEYLTSEGSSPWKPLGDLKTVTDGTFDGDLTGLQPLSDYLVRSYAINTEENVENISAPVSVSTPLAAPDVQTGGATADQSSATLTGTVNSFGGQTTYRFEFGLTADYGSRVPAIVDAIAGNERRARAVIQVVKGLQPGTTYHYRLVATNAAGTTAGADRTFTTLGADQVAPQRGYEQVSSPDKNGLSVNANFGFQVAPGGGAIEYAAAAPAADAESGVQTSRYLARRGEANWAGQQALDPPQSSGRVIITSVTLAVSDDFEHTMSVSPVALTADATTGAGNLYVKDLKTGAYERIGSATEPGAWLGFAGTHQANTFIAGAPDFSWVVLISRYRLLPGAPQVAMYKWSRTGGLSIVSRLPDDSIPTGNAAQQGNEYRANRLVSDDGDTMAFRLLGADDGVYRRSGGQTVAISASSVSGGAVQPGVPVGMSRDGRFVVFISHSKLTEDATATGPTDQPQNLYRYDAQSGGLAYLGQIVGNGDGTFDVLGISDDGGTVYFNRTRLGIDAENNPLLIRELVVWREGQVHTVISTDVVTGYPSPNGRYIVFIQNGSVFFYDADGGDQATCVSCTVNGEGGGGQVPEPERNISNDLPQAVTDDGHAFFGTSRALLAADRNSANDVYEYFQGRLTLISPGDSDFTATFVDVSPDGRDVFFTTAQGLVGQDTDGAFDIYDARIGGGLAAQNPLVTPPCVGEGCLGSPANPPAAPTPGSAQVRATENPKRDKPRCARKVRKASGGKTRCVKKQKNHHSKKRNAKNNRGASR